MKKVLSFLLMMFVAIAANAEVATLGEPVFGVDNGVITEDQINLGVKVTFPDMVLPEGVNPMDITATVTATLYGIPEGNDPMPIDMDDDVDPGFGGGNGPVVLNQFAVSPAYVEGGVLTAYLFAEDGNLEVGNHYAIIINNVTVSNGEETLISVNDDDDHYYATDFTIVENAYPSIESVEFTTAGENIAINNHSNVSVEAANGLFVVFNNCEPQNATYAIDCVDAEGEVVYSVASGMLNRGYADFGKTLTFISGYKYNVTVKAWAGEMIYDATLEAVEPIITEVYTINGANAAGIVGEPVFGVERGQITDDMINLGVRVSFPEVILPGLVDINAVEGTVSATLYGIPQGNEPMPLSGEDEVGDDNMGVDGPVEIATALFNLNDEGGVWSANLFAEQMETYNHYAIQLNAVTFTEGEEIVAELEDAGAYSVEFDVVPTVIVPVIGAPVWGVEDGQLTDDQINLGVQVSFPEFVLPEGLNPMNVSATVSATLVGVPEGNEPMPVSGEDEVGDDNMGVDGPVVLAEAVMHDAYIEGGVLTARLFAEQLELGNHYAIVLNSVMVMNGEEIIAELPEDAYYATDFVVVETAIPSIESVELTAGEENVTLNDHSTVSVEAADGIRVVFNNCEPQTATYAIDCVTAEGEYVCSAASGELSRGYASFGKNVPFVSGYQYVVNVKAWATQALDENLEPVEPMVSATYTINGANAMGIVGEPVFGVERGQITDDMINLGVRVSFPEVILPGLVDINAVEGTVSATLYGIPQGNEPMPLSGEDEVGDDNMGVDGPVEIATALFNLNDEGGVWSANLFAEQMETYNHYAIQLNAVTFTEGEEIVAELEDAGAYSTEFDVVPTVIVPVIGAPVWGVEDGQLTDDQINLGVQVSFPEFVLPEGLNPMNVSATVSATLVGVPEGNEPMPVSGEDEVGDDNMGVDGPVVLAEAVMHDAYIEGGVLTARLFAEKLELGNHYAIVLNSVMVMNGEEIIAELPEDAYYATDFVVVETAIPSIESVELTVEGADAVVLNDHSMYSVEAADGIRVVFNDCEPQTATYAIDCVTAEGEYVYSVASGELNRGYASFGKNVKFVSGYQYVVNVKAWATQALDENLEPIEPMVSATYTINGASATGIVGEPTWSVERGELSDEMINLGVRVSFPEVILPGLVDLNTVEATVSATLYGVPQGNEPMPILVDDEDVDPGMGVDGPIEIATVMVPLYNEGGEWSAYLFAEQMETYNHYAIQLNGVTFTEGEEIVAELEDAGAYSVEFTVVPTEVAPSFGEPVFTIEDGALFTEDDIHNLAIKLYFPDATGFDNAALQVDVMLQKKVEDTWVPVQTSWDETEIFFEDAWDATDAEFCPALFAPTLQNAVEGETYRIVVMDYALINMETGEPIIYEVYEGSAYIPSVTFSVVSQGVINGINSINANGNDVMFNIAGQRVNNVKGIVIKNGKKMLVK